MSEPSSFAARPFHVTGIVGFPSGVGVKAGGDFIPEIGLDARVSTSLLFQDYGVDVVFRPFASKSNIAPTAKLGMSVLQSNLTAFGGPSWLPMPSASVGFELRTKGGFVLGMDAGAAVPIRPGRGNGTTAAVVIPSGSLSIGYAFDL